jgi:hypothetical protein
MLGKEFRDSIVARYSVVEFYDVVAFIFKDQVIHRYASRPQPFDDISGLSFDDARVIAALNHEHRTLDMINVLEGRAL